MELQNPLRYIPKPKPGNALIHLFFLLLAIFCITPTILIISASFSQELDISKYGYQFFPMHFTTTAYWYLFKVPEQIIRAYGVTSFVTIIGTILSVLIMSLVAYVISRPDFPYRKIFSFFVFFPMLFSGGLVSWYIWVTQGLHLKDTLWALIMPYLVIPWYVLLLRTFFAGLPQDLMDSAQIDGASEWRVFFQIVMPISTPALATVGLFVVLNYWNDWWLALLLIDSQNLQPLQYMLYTILTNARAIQASPMATGMPLPVITVRMAMAVLAAGPAVLIFLMLQRYFVRGITIGALK
jgi:putative aldouronate transport system permease protein